MVTYRVVNWLIYVHKKVHTYCNIYMNKYKQISYKYNLVMVDDLDKEDKLGMVTYRVLNWLKYVHEKVHTYFIKYLLNKYKQIY